MDLGTLGFAVYAACVDFMLVLARILGVTYRDSNAIILLVGFPLTTVSLGVIALLQRLAIARAKASPGGPR